MLSREILGQRLMGAGRSSHAHVDILSDGTAVVKCGTQDIGTGTRTIVAIVAAETLGLPVNMVKPEIGDSTLPFSGGSGGSTTAASVSPAIRVTTMKALDALCAKVAPVLGADARSLVAESGRIHADCDTKRHDGTAGKKLLPTQRPDRVSQVVPHVYGRFTTLYCNGGPHMPLHKYKRNVPKRGFRLLPIWRQPRVRALARRSLIVVAARRRRRLRLRERVP